MSIDLFGEAPENQTTTPGRGPKGGKHYTRPRGYAGIPGLGPKGKQCRHCEHYVVVLSGSGKRFPKCDKTKPNWTHGRASDILARSPACQYFVENIDAEHTD